MLTSLFGDLPPRRLPGPAQPPVANARPAPAGPHLADRFSDDVLVDDSPAEAIRQHFAAHRPDLQRASAMVTLLDPSRLWASQVLQALAGGAGQPVQRLNLRERATLRTLAVIERTLVPRRDATALRVYHADIRVGSLGGGLDADAIGCALAEGSQLTAVIVGAMQPHALVALLRGLLQACRQPHWRCPHLVFILPPGAATLRQRILEQHWPPQVQVHAVAEPLACAASVWNQVLQAWESTLAGRPAAAAGRPGAVMPPQRRPVDIDITGGPDTVGPIGGGATLVKPGSSSTSAVITSVNSTSAIRSTNAGIATATGPQGPAGHRPLQPPVPDAPPPTAAGTHLLNRLLLPLARSEGLLACGIVDLNRGDLLASQQRDEPATDLVALAEALCAARLAHQAVAPCEAAPDEILVSAGQRQTLLRRLPGAAALGFVAVLDRQQANLALLRFKLLDAERLLG